MIVGIYATRGVFLISAAHDPLAHLSLIWFTVWSSVVHSGIMALRSGAGQPSATNAYVEERCSAGQRFEYWTFAGRNHLTIVQPGRPLEELLIRWTTGRFASEPQASDCLHKSF